MAMAKTATLWCAMALVLTCVRTGAAGEAVDALQNRAQGGAADAQYCLGVLYEAGALLDLPRDHGEAAHWFLRAAEQGHPYAQISLGHLYSQGLGVLRNDIQALSWLEIGAAAAQGPPRTAAKATRDLLIRRMPLEEILESQRTRRAWMTAHGQLAASSTVGGPVVAVTTAP